MRSSTLGWIFKTSAASLLVSSVSIPVTTFSLSQINIGFPVTLAQVDLVRAHNQCKAQCPGLQRGMGWVLCKEAARRLTVQKIGGIDPSSRFVLPGRLEFEPSYASVLYTGYLMSDTYSVRQSQWRRRREPLWRSEWRQQCGWAVPDWWRAWPVGQGSWLSHAGLSPSLGR